MEIIRYVSKKILKEWYPTFTGQYSIHELSRFITMTHREKWDKSIIPIKIIIPDINNETK